MLLSLLLFASAVASAAPATGRLEDLAQSIKYAPTSPSKADCRSSYCRTVEPTGRILARGGNDVKCECSFVLEPVGPEPTFAGYSSRPGAGYSIDS